MKAVRFHQYGGPEVLRYEDVERAVPGAGKVRLRVAATSFNPVDGGIRGGYLQDPFPVTLPHTPGIDVAGTVFLSLFSTGSARFVSATCAPSRGPSG
jgi:NADPH:quinone reductase-like Zn-dependent oxidoreductase